ncbi:MAG: nucleotide-binding domain containing protein [Acetobacteraceae bacterium]|nr:nucleotide-binding domain containing protein [Acetobacteraceae bacterium]
MRCPMPTSPRSARRSRTSRSSSAAPASPSACPPLGADAAGLAEAGRRRATAASVGGRAAVLSGSCSRATLAQVARAQARRAPPSLSIPLSIPIADRARCRGDRVERTTGAGTRHSLSMRRLRPIASPTVQAALGPARAGEIVEQAFAAIAEALVARGVRRLVVAGGETSGAVVSRLGLTRLVIGPTIDPGVPWTYAPERDLLLALKSGNFGAHRFLH